MKDRSFNGHPGIVAAEEDFNEEMKVAGVYNSYWPGLMIADPDMIQEIYTTKNKFFDKH